MLRKIHQRELRNESGAVLRAVEAGAIFVVTRNGVPVAELRPLARPEFVSRDEIAEAARRAPRIDARRFRADLDSTVDPSVRARGPK